MDKQQNDRHNGREAANANEADETMELFAGKLDEATPCAGDSDTRNEANDAKSAVPEGHAHTKTQEE